MTARWHAILALVLGGCGTTSAHSSPRATLLQVRQAAAAGDTARIYAMLPERARREESLAAFQTRLASDAAELRDWGNGVDRALQDGREPVVQEPARSGGTIAVVDDPEGWRLAQIGFGGVSTPTALAAVQAFREALQRRSLPALLAVLSASARGVLQGEIASLLDALADPASLVITTSQPNGTVDIALPDGRRLILLREGPNWRVEDVQGEYPQQP